MTFLFSLLYGYVKFSFTGGFAEQFLNSCFEKGIEIRDIKRADFGFTATCSAATYKRLHRIARSSGGRLKIYKKAGLPFIVPRLKYRLGFFVGAFAFVLIIAFLNSFVWSVEVVGNDTVSAASILYYLEDNGLKVGSPWSSFDRQKLSWNMMSDFDTLAWVHINRDGARAIVEISEVTPPNTHYDTDRLEGNTVVMHELEATAYREQSHMTLRDRKDYYTLNFFALHVPLYFTEEQGDVTSEKTTPLRIKGVNLPVSLTTTTQSFYSSEPYSLTDEELNELARRKLDILKEQELSDYEIVNESVSIEIYEDRAVASGTYVVRTFNNN